MKIWAAAAIAASVLFGASLAASAEDVTMQGTVRNSYGQSVAGAIVSAGLPEFVAAPDDCFAYVYTQTDSHGRYLLQVPDCLLEYTFIRVSAWEPASGFDVSQPTWRHYMSDGQPTGDNEFLDALAHDVDFVLYSPNYVIAHGRVKNDCSPTCATQIGFLALHEKQPWEAGCPDHLTTWTDSYGAYYLPLPICMLRAYNLNNYAEQSGGQAEWRWLTGAEFQINPEYIWDLRSNTSKMWLPLIAGF